MYLLMVRALTVAAALLPVAAGAAPKRWLPPVGATFSIHLSVAPKTVSTPAQVVDFDGFDNSAKTVSALHAQGKHVVCYFSAGSWENWRPDKKNFPAEVIGRPLDGWAGERYLDISNLAVLGPIMRARLDVCKQKRLRCRRSRQCRQLSG